MLLELLLGLAPGDVVLGSREFSLDYSVVALEKASEPYDNVRCAAASCGPDTVTCGAQTRAHAEYPGSQGAAGEHDIMGVHQTKGGT